MEISNNGPTEEELAFDAADAAGLIDGPGAFISYNPSTVQSTANIGGSTSKGTANNGSSSHTRGSSLGTFSIVGYYGAGPTYSGKYTKANHTVAADLSVLPLGTEIFIGDKVYTVEDIGSGVVGKIIDIYFDSYEEAVNVTRNGHHYEEVFLAVPVK